MTEQEKEIIKLRKQIKELKQWNDDLQSGLYVNCAYCGHRYAPGTSAVQSHILYKHIKECKQHPLYHQRRKTKRLQKMLNKTLDIIEPILKKEREIEKKDVKKIERVRERSKLFLKD